eukprot:scaffold442_cov397-Prasinococcus_capsulatus_cf.AAC.20
MLYMPHCEVLLYDNVLSANWSAEGLPRVVVLGNSFTRYLDEKVWRCRVWHPIAAWPSWRCWCDLALRVCLLGLRRLRTRIGTARQCC